jgi:hypothetical protein
VTGAFVREGIGRRIDGSGLVSTTYCSRPAEDCSSGRHIHDRSEERETAWGLADMGRRV